MGRFGREFVKLYRNKTSKSWYNGVTKVKTGLLIPEIIPVCDLLNRLENLDTIWPDLESQIVTYFADPWSINY